MFQIISFKEDGLANLALIKLCEDDSVRLLRSLNPDAEDGVQGEEFGEDTCSEEEIIESEAFKTVYEHAIAGGMSKDDAYTEAYVAALQEISPFAVRVGFVNPDTGSDDETEFDVNSIFEALNLFRNDFREDNHWKEMPKILYIESVK